VTFNRPNTLVANWAWVSSGLRLRKYPAQNKTQCVVSCHSRQFFQTADLIVPSIVHEDIHTAIQPVGLRSNPLKIVQCICDVEYHRVRARLLQALNFGGISGSRNDFVTSGQRLKRQRLTKAR